MKEHEMSLTNRKSSDQYGQPSSHAAQAARPSQGQILPEVRPSQPRLAHRAKQVVLRTPLLRVPFRELLTYRYRYMFSPSQLAFLCEQIARTSDVPGSILEVGCAFGATTVFLNRHIDTLGIDVNYYAVDTFAGFTAEDVSYEHGLGRNYRYTDFRGNSKSWFDRTMRRNGVRRVTSFLADATTFDYTLIAPFRFVLVDVDLHRPVLAVLEAVYGLMSPGGTIITDDCQEGGQWAGARDAFIEFTEAKGLDAIITDDHLGLITMPR
jgi:O-methyltransferase